MKTANCKRCDGQYQFRFNTGGYCKLCSKLNKKEYTLKFYHRKFPNRKYRTPPPADTIPPVDGLMELQFKRFFDLVMVRYTCQKDVSQTIDMNKHKKAYKRKPRL